MVIAGFIGSTLLFIILGILLFGAFLGWLFGRGS